MQMVARPDLAALSGADKTRIKAAGLRDIGCTLNHRAAIGKNSHDVTSELKPQQQIVKADGSMRPQTSLQFDKIDRPVALMNLHRVTAAERDMWATLTAQMRKVALLAHFARRSGMGGRDLRSLICPQIEGQKAAA